MKQTSRSADDLTFGTSVQRKKTCESFIRSGDDAVARSDHNAQDDKGTGGAEHDPEKAWPGLGADWTPVFARDHAPPKARAGRRSKNNRHALARSRRR